MSRAATRPWKLGRRNSDYRARGEPRLPAIQHSRTGPTRTPGFFREWRFFFLPGSLRVGALRPRKHNASSEGLSNKPVTAGKLSEAWCKVAPRVKGDGRLRAKVLPHWSRTTRRSATVCADSTRRRTQTGPIHHPLRRVPHRCETWVGASELLESSRVAVAEQPTLIGDPLVN